MAGGTVSAVLWPPRTTSTSNVFHTNQTLAAPWRADWERRGNKRSGRWAAGEAELGGSDTQEEEEEGEVSNDALRIVLLNWRAHVSAVVASIGHSQRDGNGLNSSSQLPKSNIKKKNPHKTERQTNNWNLICCLILLATVFYYHWKRTKDVNFRVSEWDRNSGRALRLKLWPWKWWWGSPSV